ncbi:hypothetical protein MPSEU_000179900 [Mayamaea pseudoterrestris]|nr:hypothetical protein MPSEU_000179900 [Mayamaea pseudoterrestris]
MKISSTFVSRAVGRVVAPRVVSARVVIPRASSSCSSLAFRHATISPAASSIRSFSSSSSPSDDLLALLQREYDEEVEHNSTAMPKELANLQAELEAAGWKIVANSATTKLMRTLPSNNAKIQVSFHVQDTVVDETSFMEELEDQDEDQDIEPSARARFTVALTKPGGKHMVFTCIAEDAQAAIESVAISSSATTSVDDILKAGSVDDEQYQGPEFGELAEDLQESFQEYLQEEVGINESVASFITMYADYREQAEYVEFLKEAQEVLK